MSLLALIELLKFIPEELIKDKLFGYLKSKQTSFKKIVSITCDQVQQKYPDALGGDLKRFLTTQLALDELRKVLIPNYLPNEANLGIDLPSLPNDFLADLKRILLEELFKSDEFRSDVLSLLGRLSIEQQLVELRDKIESLTISISPKGAELQEANNLHLPPKKIYTSRTRYYVEREFYFAQYYSASREDKLKWQGTHNLKNLIREIDKLVILSSAGQGKSTELLETASYLCQQNEGPFPILIQLNTYDGESIEDMISNAYKFWHNIPKAKIVLLFDGLDEVHTSQFNKLIKKIVSFKGSDENKEITLIIACRDNIFPLELAAHGFKTFKLRPLTDLEISSCIEKALGATSDQFLEATKSNGVYEFLSNPFFLNYALELFLSKSLIVKSKVDLFEKFINYRIEEDQRKNASTGLALEKHELLIRNEITRVALVMELLGRNFLAELEFQKVVPSYSDIRVLLERTFLLDLQETRKWQFEHNNFQEYLAAKALATKEIKTIQAFVAFQDYRKVKPTWVNTLSFIIIIADDNLFDDLLTWLIEIEPELLLRFEKERVDLNTRERIFQKILESFQNKGIATRNEKFDIEQLADYVSESHKVLEYLSDRISTATSTFTIIEIARILHRFGSIKSAKSLFENTLVQKITSPDIRDDAKYTCLQTIGELGWGNQTQLDQIMAVLDVTKSENLRAGIFSYINFTKIVDQNIELIIKLSEPLDRKNLSVNGQGGRSRPAFASEDLRLADCYRSVKTYEATKKVIDYLKELTEENIYEFLRAEVVDQIIENSTALFKLGTDERIVNDVITLFESYSRRYMVHYDKSFRAFFEKTGTTKMACDYFYKKRNNEGKVDTESIQALSVLCDRNYVDFLIEEFKVGNLNREETLTIRWNFSLSKRGEFHDLFHAEINTISGGKYQYLQEDPYTAKRRRQHQTDLDLLHDKSEFYKRIGQIFELEDKEEVSKEDLIDYRKKYNEDDTYLDNTIVLRFVREFIDEITTTGTASESSLRNYLDQDSNWESFQICILIEYDKNNTIQFGDRELHFIQSWIQKHLSVYDFSERITSLHVWIAYFIRRLDCTVPQITLLNMFRVDYSYFPSKHVQNQKDREETISEYVIRKVGLDAARSKISDNLNLDLLDGEEMVIQHAELCLKHELFESISGLEHQLQNKKINDHYLTKLIECYLKLGGAISLIDQLLQTEESRFKKYDLFKLCDLLIEHDSKFVTTYLIKTLNGESYDEETKLHNALLLLKLGSIEGLDFYKNWFKEKKKQGMHLNRINISKLPGDRALPLFFEILDSYLEPDFEREGVFGDDNTILDWVVEIGSQSKELFSQVSEYFLNRIESRSATWLYYRLQTLEQKYFTKLALSLPIEEAITIANKAFV